MPKPTSKKRNLNAPNSANKKTRKTKHAVGDNSFNWSGKKADKQQKEDEIESSDDSEDEQGNPSAKKAKNQIEEEVVDELTKETADEKRVRLAKEYLEQLADAHNDGSDNDDHSENEGNKSGITGEDRISAQLKEDVLEASGKLYRQVAEKLENFDFDENSSKILRGHKRPVTAVCLTDDDTTAFSAAKDGSIVRWDMASGTKVKFVFPDEKERSKIPDHKKTINALAVSSDGRYLCSGGNDKLVHVWDARTNELIETFSGHRDVITSLCFRANSHMLFSGSNDRTIKHWNLTEMGYVETLFGHQSEVNGLDCLWKERVISCGRDRSVRVWKIAEETQLVFHGKTGSIDCIRMVNDEYSVSGADDGSLVLWFNGRKKPVLSIEHAHGSGHWINSVSSLRRSDLVASGSSDGIIRLWKADIKGRSLNKVACIPVEGHVNSMAFSKSGRFLIAGIGQEHRLGRWDVNKKAKNGISLIALPNLLDD